jgi:hypothetical protein
MQILQRVDNLNLSLTKIVYYFDPKICSSTITRSKKIQQPPFGENSKMLLNTHSDIDQQATGNTIQIDNNIFLVCSRLRNKQTQTPFKKSKKLVSLSTLRKV